MSTNGFANGVDRLPPHNRDAERAIIATMLREHHVVPEIVGLVRAGDFYADAHQRIFAAISELADAGKPPDLVAVAHRLMEANRLEDCGGNAYIAEMRDTFFSAVSFRHHAEIVRELSARRRTIHACQEISQSAYDLGTPTVEFLDAAERQILEIADLSFINDASDLRTALNESYIRLDARRNNDGQVTGVPTGWLDLDSLLCGFQNSELIIVGARPSIGKTAFALNIARYAAIECNLPVLFVSLEQARIELADRLLSCHGRIDSHRMRRGYLNAEEQTRIMEAGDAMSGANNIFIDDAPSQTMLRIAASARRMQREHGIRLVIVDYLQLIVSENYRASRQEQVADSSRRLKALARELKVPVIALCQVNRGPEDRPDKRPRLSDLRESGAIEADADTVLLLHRPEPGGAAEQVEIIVGKQRNGATGEVSLMFMKNYMRFENFAIEHQAQGGGQP